MERQASKQTASKQAASNGAVTVLRPGRRREEGALDARGGQAARRLRRGQRARQLAHAPQARGYVLGQPLELVHV